MISRLALVAMSLLVAFGVIAAATNELSDAEIQGRELVRQLLEQKPATNFVQNGVLKIRDGNGKRLEYPFKYEVKMGWVYVMKQSSFDWSCSYTAVLKPNTDGETLFINFGKNQPNTYIHHYPWHSADGISLGWPGRNGQSDASITNSFAGSDFSLADLGLEFFHWPQQKILKKEFRRSCGCMVLESVNPNPTPGSYSRVVTWIDEESFGIVQAEAYDSKNKLLKQFYPKDIKKVKGQWQVQTMDISNVQTGSRTRIEFHLESH